MSSKLRYILLLLIFCMPFGAFAESEKPFTVVIDAGHGGKDPGAIGKISYEKDLNLSIALLTGQMIQDQYPGVKVVYTRTTDVFLPLQERADIVNKNNANLFICIHTNSSESRVAKGVETFVLGTEKMEKNLDVAMRENSVIKLEKDYKTTYQGFDPNSIDSYIMFELMQNTYMDQSLQYATFVQRQFVEKLHRAERGVRQAAFWVLLKSACPSILLEIGFISNPDEEKYLASENGQKEMATALCTAFGQFSHRKAVLKSEPLKQIKKDTVPPQSVALDTMKVEEKPLPVPSDSLRPVVDSVARPHKKDTVAHASKPETRPVQQTQQKENKPSQQTQQKENKSSQQTQSKQVVTTDTADADTVPVRTYFAVQVLASRKPLSAKAPCFKGIKFDCLELDGWYKYYKGATLNRSEATATMRELKKDFPDCWIITFKK